MASVNEVRHPLSFRILHEIIMASILLLIMTGYYIHLPFTGGMSPPTRGRGLKPPRR